MNAVRTTAATSTVLVVEDEDSFIEALTIGLAREGFTVHAAKDGTQALELFDSLNPDLVLVDLRLPRMSGTEICKQLRD